MTSSPPLFRFGLAGGRWAVHYARTVAGRADWLIPVVARARPLPLPEPFENIPVITDWRGLAAPHHQLDGVILVTPSPMHEEMAQFFIEHDLPVIIEKPLCFDPSAARRLQALARQRGAIAWVDHTHCFHPAFRELLRLIEGQPILELISEADNLGPFRADTPAFWDWMPHDTAMILTLTGNMPMHIKATVRERVPTPDGMGETMELCMTFAEGLTTRTTVRNHVMPKRRMMVVRTGTIALRYDGLADQPLTRLPPDTPSAQLFTAEGETIATPRRLPLDVLLDEFSSAVRRRDAANSSLELGCQVTDILAEGWQQMTKG